MWTTPRGALSIHPVGASLEPNLTLTRPKLEKKLTYQQLTPHWPAHHTPVPTSHPGTRKWAVVVAVGEVGWLSAISYLGRLDACPHSCRVAPAGGEEPIRRGPWGGDPSTSPPLHLSTSPPLPPHLSISPPPSPPLHWRCLRPSRRLLQHRSCGAPLVERRDLEGELPV